MNLLAAEDMLELVSTLVEMACSGRWSALLPSPIWKGITAQLRLIVPR